MVLTKRNLDAVKEIAAKYIPPDVIDAESHVYRKLPKIGMSEHNWMYSRTYRRVIWGAKRESATR